MPGGKDLARINSSLEFKHLPGSERQHQPHHKGTFTISTMNRAFAVFLCCAVVLHATGIQGIPTSGRGRCICPPMDSDFVPRGPLGKVEIYSVSTSCDRVEIIVTLKSGDQQCLNPASKHVKAMLAKIAQNRALKTARRRGPAASSRNSPQ